MREMKDSGIEWIGKIPRHWIYPKITYILDTEHEYPIGDGDHGTIKADNYVQEGIPFIRVQNLGFATPLRLDDVVYITKKQNITIKNSTLKPDDILFAKTGATIGKVGIVPKELLISNTTSHVGKITVNKKIIVPRFLFYALSSTVGYKLLWDIAGQKSTRPELSIEEIKRLHIILPDSLQEQQTIVDYLDAKCADIDSLTADIQKQINILKEYKKSVITQAVTKGLDPNVEMKDSGIAWIGKIPKHWSVSKLKYLGRLQNGISKSHNFFGRGNPFITYGDVYNNDKLPLQGSGLIMSTLQEQRLYSIKRGDVFFTRTSETIEEIGFASTCIQNVDNATFAGFLIRFRPINECLLPEFSRYYFRSEIHRHFFVKEMNLVTRASLGQILLGKLPVLLPAIDEQHLIVDFLDAKCADIDAAIAGKQKQLDVLKEYKKSLIYEYVTGKKEVPCRE